MESKAMNTNKNWGKWSAILIFVSILIINSLFAVLDSSICLSYNPFRYWENFVFACIVAGLVLFLTYKYYTKCTKTVRLVFIVSVIVLQNLLISGFEHLLLMSADEEGAGFTFVISVPVAFAIVFLYGYCFDIIKNKANLKSNQI